MFDPDPQAAHLFAADEPPRILSADDNLAIPDLLGEARVTVRRFFE